VKSSIQEEHEDNTSNKPFNDSILGQSEEYEGTSKENSTIAEENIDRSSSFVIDSNRKYSFMSTPRQDGKHGRSNSYEHCYSMPNLDSSTPPNKKDLLEESKGPEQIVWSYDNKNTLDVPSNEEDDKFRKSSIDEEGLLERERVREQIQQQIVEGVVSRSASILKPTINIIEAANSQQNVAAEDKKGRSRAGSNVDVKISPIMGAQASPKLNETGDITLSTTPTFTENNERLSIRKGSAVDIDKYLTREFPKFSGDIYLQISSEKSWNKYFGKIEGSCLLLYPTILDNFPLHFVPCFRAVVKYVQNHHGEYIELYHHYDSEILRICIDPNSHNQEDMLVAEKNLRVWEAQLRMASEKIVDLELTDNNYYYAVGKLQLVVCDASDIKLLPSRSSCFLRIKHKPYVLHTSKSLSGESMKWKQSFFIPISDVFFPITLELVCSYNDGWMTQSLKEEVICTLEIPVQDLLSLPSNEILQVNLPFKYTDQRKAKVAKSLGINENDLSSPNLRLKFNNLSSVKSYFAPPYADYVEGVKMDTDTFTKQGLKLSLARIRRIISYIILFFRDIRNLFHFKYPFFSYVCSLLLISLIALFDVADTMAVLIGLMGILCFYNHPKVNARVKPALDMVFFGEGHLNPFYRDPEIKTLSDLEMEETFNTERWKYKLTDDESIYSVMKRAKKSVVWLTIFFTKVSGFFEKMKNIIMWQDHRRSMIFLICTVIGYCIFAVVPLRLLIFAGVTAKFIKGINYFKNLRQKNRQAAMNTINFILNKQYGELAKFVANTPNEPWPTTPSILKKLAQQLKLKLDIDLPEDALIQTYKTPEQLIKAIESCRVHLKFKQDASEASAEMMQRKDPKFKIDNLFYFIMNIPSDYYRVIQPKIIYRESKKDA